MISTLVVDDQILDSGRRAQFHVDAERTARFRDLDRSILLSDQHRKGRLSKRANICLKAKQRRLEQLFDVFHYFY